MKNLTILPLFVFSLAFSGCAVTTAGVKKGDERNVARSINDVSAERVIKSRMARAYDFNLKGIDVEAREGIVVLTGNAPTQADRIEAERIAWSAQRIDQVGNEIAIEGPQSITRNFKDGLLEKSVRARLTADKYVKARNLNVETHEGKVYLLGVARNQAELERAAQIASETKGAREVISYVTVAGIDSKINQIAQGRNAPATNVAAPSFAQQKYVPQAQLIQQAPPVREVRQRSVPSFLSTTPQGAQATPPLSHPIPFVENAPLQSPTAPAQIADMGDRLNKEFPSTDDLGKFRTGAPGEAVSIIESEPYYLDPKTGKEIPVSFIRKFKK